MMLGIATSFAQTTNWTGSVSSDWSNASNWSNGVPGPGFRAVITNQTNKPVLNTSATVNTVQFGSYWPGPGITSLTVISGGTLTITNEMEFNGDGGSLHIDGGTVDHTGTTLDWGSNVNRYIEMTSGSFTTNANFSINGGNKSTQPGFSAGSGTATFNGNLIVSSSSSGKWFDAGSGDIEVLGDLTIQNGAIFDLGTAAMTVAGTTTVNGTFNGEDGAATFDGPSIVSSGGVLTLDNGYLEFNSTLDVQGNGNAYFGSGTVDINNDVQVQSSGYFYVQDATININGDADFSNNGNLIVDSGSINVAGNASVTSGGSMTLGGGNLQLSGDFEVTGGSSFTADSSTVTFSGDSTQTITTNGNDITFNDVVVDSGATFQTDGGTGNVVVVEGDLTVNEGGNVNVQDDDQLDVQGEVGGDGSDNIQSPAPFAVSAVATDVNTVVINFNKTMVESFAENVSNYSIIRLSNSSTITVSSATLNTAGDNKKVTLSISTIQEDVTYQITMNNLESTDGGELSENHRKNFTKVGPITFYSITSGNWATNSTWSRTGHAGAAATSNPGNTNNATVIIGDGDVVTLASSTSIVNQTAVQVTGGSTLRVGTGGNLTTGSKTITGAGTFEVTTGTLRIGSTAGITTSGATGNIQTTTRNFGASGSYVYNGSAAQNTGNGIPSSVQNLTINNSAGVTFTNTNIEVNGTLSLTNGVFTIGSGKNLIANTKSIGSGSLRMLHAITGTNGWRLLSSPVDTDYDDFLDKTVTQGYTGAYYSTGSDPGDTLQPNVLWYLEDYEENEEELEATDNDRWRAPASASTDLTAGRGLFTYIFGDIDADPNYNDVLPLPLTLDAQGQENEGPLEFGVTYNIDGGEGWNLVGNPYAATIDWDDAPNWTKTNIDQTIYIWDYDTNQFLTWNGTTGDLGSGLIAPFQGFWVKANAASPSLIVEEDAKTTGGTFVGKSVANREKAASPKFSITMVDSENKEVSAHFMFSENASIGKDPLDGFRLNPYSGITDYMELSSVTKAGEKFAINNLPRKFGIPIEIPLQVDVYEDGFSASDNMYFKFQNFEHIPEGWTITLIDKKENLEVNIHNNPSYIFSHTAINGEIAPNAAFGGRAKVQSKANEKKARFILRIEPGEDADDIPSQYKLEQNYPNPFNPTTNIQFNLPLQGVVSVTIYDILGREISTLVNEELSAGTHTFTWDASRYSSGIYIYRLVTPNAVVSKKMTLIK
jgi:hypothetical protein